MRLTINKCLFFVVFILLFCTTTKQVRTIIESEKSMLNDSLFPEIITTKIPIVAILPTGSKYGMVAITASGSIYSFKSITEEPCFEKVDKVGFDEPCKNYESNPDLPYICGTGTRDYQIVDLENHKVFKDIISSNGNERFFLTYLLKSNEPVLLFTLDHIGWNDSDSYEVTYRYDFEKKKAIKFTDQYYGSLILQVEEKMILRGEMKPGSQPYLWDVMKFDFKEKIRNDLTDTLMKLNLYTFKQCYNKPKRMLICFSRDTSSAIFTIAWDSLYKDVSSIPWTFQEPGEIISGKDLCFDQTGTWLRNTASFRSNLDSVCNVFYHISDKYPAHVSIPIFGFKAVEGVPGTFLETPEWGTVYVDLSHGLEGVLMVYKMRDVMERIIARAKEMK
jgi:hypothetical protein